MTPRLYAALGFPVRPPAPGQVRPRHRVHLVAEILVAYVPLVRRLRDNDLRRLATQVRGEKPAKLATMDADETLLESIRLGHVVLRTLARFPTDKRCLIRSLVLVRMLHMRAIEADLVIGVAPEGPFAAHAWVERSGVALLPRGSYVELTRL